MARKQNPAAYHLIDEEIHSQSVHEESCWDTDHRGAGAFYPPTYEYRPVKSVNTTYPTFRKRNITEETAGILTDVYLDGDTPYIPFDTKSALKKIPQLYYEWDAPTETLTIFGKKVGKFVVGCQTVQIDNTALLLEKPFALTDGIPHIDAAVLAKILGMHLTVTADCIALESVSD